RCRSSRCGATVRSPISCGGSWAAELAGRSVTRPSWSRRSTSTMSQRRSPACSRCSDRPNTRSYHVGSIANGLVRLWTPCYVLPQVKGESLPVRSNRTMAVAVRTAHASSPQKAQRELEDLQLIMKARNGDGSAMDALIRRYTGFVRLKASSYCRAGGDSDDLIQEGLIGLYKAVRDFRTDKETSFRSFA